jgi:hypothetical protein
VDENHAAGQRVNLTRIDLRSGDRVWTWHDRCPEVSAPRTALPAGVEPAAHKLVDDPPEGPEYPQEIKFDGYPVLSDEVKRFTSSLGCLLPQENEWRPVSCLGYSRFRSNGGRE